MNVPPISLPPYIDSSQPPANEPWKYKKVVHRWRTEWNPIGQYPCMTPPATSNTNDIQPAFPGYNVSDK